MHCSANMCSLAWAPFLYLDSSLGDKAEVMMHHAYTVGYRILTFAVL